MENSTFIAHPSLPSTSSAKAWPLSNNHHPCLSSLARYHHHYWHAGHSDLKINLYFETAYINCISAHNRIVLRSMTSPMVLLPRYIDEMPIFVASSTVLRLTHKYALRAPNLGICSLVFSWVWWICVRCLKCLRTTQGSPAYAPMVENLELKATGVKFLRKICRENVLFCWKPTSFRLIRAKIKN